jgi:hypothetical protein
MEYKRSEKSNCWKKVAAIAAVLSLGLICWLFMRHPSEGSELISKNPEFNAKYFKEPDLPLGSG